VTLDNPYNYVTVDNDFMHLTIPGETSVAKKDKMELLDMAGYYGYGYLPHHSTTLNFRGYLVKQHVLTLNLCVPR